MQGNKGRDTAPELRLRRLLHARGLRYRVGIRPVKDLRRYADIAFTKRRVLVFVDGCFWHGCPIHSKPVRTNSSYWDAKIARNVERDGETDFQMSAAGWRVVRVWEHEDFDDAAQRIERLIKLR